MARPLSIHTIQTCDSFLPQNALKALGAQLHDTQGAVYVVARTKKDATERLSTATGGRVRPTSVFPGTGFDVEAVATATTFLNSEGDLIAMQNRKVAVCRGGSWFLVGKISYKDPASPHKLLQKPIFVPVATPAKPVRITIELDVNTDPAVIKTFLVGHSVIVASSISDKATGKVVES